LAFSVGDVWQLRRFAAMLGEYTRAHLLRAGLELSLFDAMRQPVRAAKLASALELDEDLLVAWLRAASAHGLVRSAHHPVDAYQVTRDVRWLIDSPDRASLVALLDQTVETYAPALERAPKLLRGGERPEFGATKEAQRAAEISLIIEGRALEVLSRVPGASKARHVLDIGCGYGTYLSGLLKHYRDANGVGVEVDPDVAEQARRRLIDENVSRRGEIRVGDFMALDIEAGTFDLALLNNNLYYFPPDQHRALFGKVKGYLSAGGVLAIQTPIATAYPLPRLAGLTRTTTAFDLFARSHSNLYGLPDVVPLHALLREVGFASIGETNIIPGGSVRYLWARTAK
jgi:SAM-dependent methyltransferase